MRFSVVVMAVLFCAPQMAFAALDICNKTAAPRTVGVAYGDGKGGWRSEGWWTIAPADCTTVQGGALKQRYYYFTVKGAAAAAADDFAGEGYSFCVQDQSFELDGADAGCAEKGQSALPFSMIDTGETAKDYAFDLTDAAFVARKGTDAALPAPADPVQSASPAAPAGGGNLISGPATVDAFTRGQSGEPFSVQAVVQSCATADFDGCIFYANGSRWAAARGAGSNEAALDVMAALPPASLITVEGDVVGMGDITADVLISRIDVGYPDANYDTLLKLQGGWVSIDDPKSRIVIAGSEQTDFYDDEMVMQSMLSFADTCPDGTPGGPVLLVQPMGGDPEGALCYSVDSVTDTQLNLFYAAAANTLVYNKE